jgi:type I restriction enzyme S subunit
MNVSFPGFDPDGLVYLNDQQAEQLKEVTVRPGDVLLNITGASIGRVCQAPESMANARVNQHVCIIRLNDGVLS